MRFHLHKILHLVISLSFLWACNKSSDTAPQLYDISTSISHDGNTRTYLVHLPKSYYNDNTKKYPVVFALHGGFGSAVKFVSLTGLNAKSDASDFVVVYPDGLPNPSGARTWNAGKCCGQNASTLNTDDVGFISKLIDQINLTYRIDIKKVYATGHSNGAMLCYRLANEIPNKIAAIAPNAGNIQIKTAYAPSRQAPVVHIHSKLDNNVKYLGGASANIPGLFNPPVDSCLTVAALCVGSSKSTDATSQ